MQSTLKAIQLSQLENTLVEVNREIKKHEGIISSVKVPNSLKDKSKKKLINLVKTRNDLVDKITSASLLE